MKTKGVLHRVMIAGVVGLILTGCCRSTNCDCNFPSVGVFYESDSLSCPIDFPNLVTVMELNQATNENLGEPLNYFFDNCAIDISFKSNRYWVISSDSLGIADTLRITDLSMYNPENKCCDCGPQIANITLEIDGQVSPGNTIVRKY